MLAKQNSHLILPWLLESLDPLEQEKVRSCLPPSSQCALENSAISFPVAFSPGVSSQYICQEALHPSWVEKALKKVPKSLRGYITATIPEPLSSKIKHSSKESPPHNSTLQAFLFPYLNAFYEELGLLPSALHTPAPPQVEQLLTLNEEQIQQCQHYLALFAITPVLHTVIEKSKREALKEGLHALEMRKSPIAFIRHLQKAVFVTQNPCPHLQFPLHLWDTSPSHLTELAERYGRGAFGQLLKDTPPDFLNRFNKNLAPGNEILPSNKPISKKIQDDLYKALAYVLSYIQEQDAARN